MKKVEDVYKKLSALVWKEDDLYVAKCLEVEITSQGETKEFALDNLKEALELYFEDEPMEIKLPSFNQVTIEKIQIAHA